MGIERLWKKSKGEGIKIAVLDTGCPVASHKLGKTIIHPDLSRRIIFKECKSFVPSEGVEDFQGHSTAVCGVIAAEDNQLGFVGYAPEAKIITYKVLNRNGCGSIDWIVDALNECIKTKPDIVSMSLGSISGTPELESAVKTLDSMGIPVICAAGNGGEEEGVNYPAKYNESFAIAAYDENMKIANFSAIGNEIDFAFPGVNIATTWLNGEYTVISGTSFACPACTGLVALIMSYAKKTGTMPSTKNTMWIYNELLRSASNNTIKRNDWGWGHVDVSSMLDETASSQSTKTVADIIEYSTKNKLYGHDVVNDFTEERLTFILSYVENIDDKEIVSIIRSIPTDCTPSLFLYTLKTAGNKTQDCLDKAEKELNANLRKTVLKWYSFILPSHRKIAKLIDKLVLKMSDRISRHPVI